MTNRNLEAQSVAVCGSNSSGQAIARTLVTLGKQVVVTDSRPAEKLATNQAALAAIGVELIAGAHDESTLRSADLVVLSPGVALATPSVQAAAQAGVPVWGEVELASRLTSARLIGVTGTKGKSTTCALLATMLDAPLANCEAWSAEGVPLITLVLEEPAAETFVVELSSYQLEGIVTLRPAVACLLNVASDHVDRHPTRADYLAAKARIFMNQQASDRSAYDWDDPEVRAVGESLATYACGMSRHGRPPRGVWTTPVGPAVDLPAPVGLAADPFLPWSSFAPGLRLQQPSAQAACLTALLAGADPDRVRQVVSEFPPLPHRMELVREWRGITFINDSKSTNPLATANAIRQTPGPCILLAGGQTKGIDLSGLAPELARLKAMVVYGEDAGLLAEAASGAGVPTLQTVATLAEAISAAVALAVAGDYVVLSPCGASFDQFRGFAHRGEVFRGLVAGL